MNFVKPQSVPKKISRNLTWKSIFVPKFAYFLSFLMYNGEEEERDGRRIEIGSKMKGRISILNITYSIF